jgi:hypothetical protein
MVKKKAAKKKAVKKVVKKAAKKKAANNTLVEWTTLDQVGKTTFEIGKVPEGGFVLLSKFLGENDKQAEEKTFIWEDEAFYLYRYLDAFFKDNPDYK